MNKSKLITLALLIAASFSLAFTSAVETLDVNVKQSVITWKGYKVTGSHYGNVQLKEGSLQFNNGQLTGGSFVIDMASITCNDMQGGGAEKLVNHLKSDDFFGVAKHPTAKLVITQVISRGTPGSYKVQGNLTIKNITKPVKFNAQVNDEGGKKVAVADLTIDRSEYDVRFGSGSFFESLGDKTIYDEFDMSVKIVTE